MHDRCSGDECLHAGVRKLLQKVCKRILDSGKLRPAFKSYSGPARRRRESDWREHLTTLQSRTAAEAEHRSPAFHIKLKIKAWDLFKGCSFVCVTALHKAQTKISAFFFFWPAQLAACQHEGWRPVPDQEYTLVFCYESSLCYCFYLRETTRFISTLLSAGVMANAQSTVVHRKLTWMLAFPLFSHRQIVSSLTFDLPNIKHTAFCYKRVLLKATTLLWSTRVPVRRLGHEFMATSLSPSARLRLLTYELVQEDERGDVTGQAQELAHDHEPVPRLNGESHHQQLRQDQRGEGDGDDVHELGLEEQQRSVHDDASCGEQQQHTDSALHVVTWHHKRPTSNTPRHL